MRKTFFVPKQSMLSINMTPIIDVALVLVIILMITAPILNVSDLAVDLPTTRVRDAQAGKRVSITLDRAGKVAVDKVVVDRRGLVGALGNRLRQPGQANLLVVVRADGGIPYEMVRGVLEDARRAGARRLAIATTPAADAEGQETTWTP